MDKIESISSKYVKSIADLLKSKSTLFTDDNFMSKLLSSSSLDFSTKELISLAILVNCLNDSFRAEGKSLFPLKYGIIRSFCCANFIKLLAILRSLKFLIISFWHFSTLSKKVIIISEKYSDRIFILSLSVIVLPHNGHLFFIDLIPSLYH